MCRSLIYLLVLFCGCIAGGIATKVPVASKETSSQTTTGDMTSRGFNIGSINLGDTSIGIGICGVFVVYFIYRGSKYKKTSATLVKSLEEMGLDKNGKEYIRKAAEKYGVEKYLHSIVLKNTTGLPTGCAEVDPKYKSTLKYSKIRNNY